MRFRVARARLPNDRSLSGDHRNYKNTGPIFSKQSPPLADAPQGVSHHEQDRIVTDRIFNAWQCNGQAAAQ